MVTIGTIRVLRCDLSVQAQYVISTVQRIQTSGFLIMLEGEGLIVYAMTCSILYVSLTCLAWRLESRDSNFCGTFFSKFGINAAYICRLIAATSSWYGLSGLATVGVRFIFHKWVNGKFNYFFLFSCLCAWVKWGLTISVLSLRYV